MKDRKQAVREPAQERLQNRLLFWLGAALAPEAAPWYFGFAPSLYRQMELSRQAAAATDATEQGSAETQSPAESEVAVEVEAERRAA
jgi:hypothetical protein